jgi:hypothetical protein
VFWVGMVDTDVNDKHDHNAQTHEQNSKRE